MTTTIRKDARKVMIWRFDQLRQAGYREREALELAERGDVDLHLAVDLMRSGCDPRTALRILR